MEANYTSIITQVNITPKNVALLITPSSLRKGRVITISILLSHGHCPLDVRIPQTAVLLLRRIEAASLRNVHGVTTKLYPPWERLHTPNQQPVRPNKESRSPLSPPTVHIPVLTFVRV